MGRRNTFARVGRPRAGLALVVAQGVIAGPALSAVAPGVALQPGTAVEHQPDVEVLACELVLDLLPQAVEQQRPHRRPQLGGVPV